jgi:hypothetical protein
MDLNRVSTDAVLKQTLERATALPEDEKITIIKVIDGYCMAVGLRQQFAPDTGTNSRSSSCNTGPNSHGWDSREIIHKPKSSQHPEKHQDSRHP